MALDEEQLALLDDLRKRGAFDAWGPFAAPTPGQTIRQQKNFGVFSFQYTCQFMGLDFPEDEDVRDALRELWSQ